LAKQIRLSRIRHVELRHLLVATFLPEVVEADADVFPSQAIPEFQAIALRLDTAWKPTETLANKFQSL
jgi:hypothetical protein